MKGLEEQRDYDIIDAARQAMAVLRGGYDDAVAQAAQFWKRQLADEIAARIIDEQTMTLDQMADVYRRINAVLDGARLELDIVLHADERCYELNAGSVRL